MNYAQARQRQTDSRWDWTVANRRTGTYPAGYCGGWKYDEWLAKDDGLVPREHLAQEAERCRPFQAKYHTDGHATKEEAERCHYEYEMDVELREMSEGRDTQHGCQAQECSAWTSKALGLGGYGTHHTWLCDEHRTREIFATLHPFSPGVTEAYS